MRARSLFPLAKGEIVGALLLITNASLITSLPCKRGLGGGVARPDALFAAPCSFETLVVWVVVEAARKLHDQSNACQGDRWRPAHPANPSLQRGGPSSEVPAHRNPKLKHMQA